MFEKFEISQLTFLPIFQQITKSQILRKPASSGSCRQLVCGLLAPFQVTCGSLWLAYINLKLYVLGVHASTS
jgi:hypothetical protein